MSTLRAEFICATGQKLQARLGDLTQEVVDAIVNAANGQLAHGGGVAGAIVRAGGYAIQEESNHWVREHGPVHTGQVAVTHAGRLPGKFVIHAVGPVWQGGNHNEDELLRLAVWHSLLKAHELELTSISMPAISSGIYGFPKERCAEVLVKTAVDFCARLPDSKLQEVRFTNFDELTAGLFEEQIRRLGRVK
jgi:putative ATPase